MTEETKEEDIRQIFFGARVAKGEESVAFAAFAYQMFHNHADMIATLAHALILITCWGEGPVTEEDRRKRAKFIGALEVMFDDIPLEKGREIINDVISRCDASALRMMPVGKEKH